MLHYNSTTMRKFFAPSNRFTHSLGFQTLRRNSISDKLVWTLEQGRVGRQGGGASGLRTHCGNRLARPWIFLPLHAQQPWFASKSSDAHEHHSGRCISTRAFKNLPFNIGTHPCDKELIKISHGSGRLCTNATTWLNAECYEVKSFQQAWR